MCEYEEDIRCKKCNDIIPEWSFICPVCFCNEFEEETK